MLIILISFYILLATVSYGITGDSCVADGQLGTCTKLSLCPAVVKEIRDAGSPIPRPLAYKLQQITCGYIAFEPLVCCADSEAQKGGPNDKSPPNNNRDIYDRPLLGKTENQKIFIGPLIDSAESKKSDIKTDGGPPNITGHPNLDKLPDICGQLSSQKITTNGKRVPLYEMPWMVILYYNTTNSAKLNCGGTLINEWYVLTAAHCVAFLDDKIKLDHVILGEWDVTTDPDCEMVEEESGIVGKSCAPKKKDVGIKYTKPHPGYSPQTLADDIALIRLAEPADLTLETVSAICLPVSPELQQSDLVGMYGQVAGWGVTERWVQSPVLTSVDLRIMSNSDCQQVYRGSPRIHATQICAGGDSNQDSCGGDSGGPLMYPGFYRKGVVKQVQRGIVSYGPRRCGIGGIPGVYTNVAYYMDWILNNIS